MTSINIDAADVNKMVTDAILNSAIGDTLRAVVSKKVADLASTHNNPVELEVDRQIKLIIHEIVDERFKPMIAAKVDEMLTDELVTRISLAAWKSLVDQFDRYKF